MSKHTQTQVLYSGKLSREKTVMNSHKTAKFAKVFSLGGRSKHTQKVKRLLRVGGSISAGVSLTSFICVVPESSYSSNAASNSLLVFALARYSDTHCAKFRIFIAMFWWYTFLAWWRWSQHDRNIAIKILNFEQCMSEYQASAITNPW